MHTVERELGRTLRLLRSTIFACGTTQLEVQEPLGWGRSYISQLLTKQKELRVEQVLLILKVLGVAPEDFYTELYRWSTQERSVPPPPPPFGPQQAEEVAREIDRLLAHLRSRVATSGWTQIEIQERLGWGRSYISQLFGKQKLIRVGQVLAMLSVIGVESSTFYLELYRPTKLGEAAPTSPAVAAEDTSQLRREVRELKALVLRMARLLEGKEILTREELTPAVAVAKGRPGSARGRSRRDQVSLPFDPES